MPQLYELCSYCGNNFMACNCENYHPPTKVVKLEEGEVILNPSEVKLLIHFLNMFNYSSNSDLFKLIGKLVNSRIN